MNENNIFNNIKENISIEEVFSIYSSSKLISTGNGNYRCICPFHQEKDASLHIYSDTNSFFCFGCQKGGSVIDASMYMNDVDCLEAVKILAKDFNFNISELSIENKKKFEEKNIKEKKLREYINYTHSNLTDRHREILKNRGLVDKIIDMHSIGYEPKSNGPGDLNLYSKTGYYLPRNRIVIPILKHGSSVGLIFWDFTGNQKPKYLYPSGFKKSLIGVERIKKEEGVYLVEGIFDYYSFLISGIPVICSLGTCLSQDQLNVLSRAKKFFVAFDNDDKEQTRNNAIRLLEEFPHKSRLIEFEKGKDPNDVYCEKPQEFKQTIEKLRIKSKSMLDITLEKSVNVGDWELADFLNASIFPLMKNMTEAEVLFWFESNADKFKISKSKLSKLYDNFLKKKCKGEDHNEDLISKALDVEIVHPAMEQRKNLALLGGRIKVPEEDDTVNDKNVFILVQENKKPEVIYESKFSLYEQEYIIDINDRVLISLDEKWKLKDLRRFFEDPKCDIGIYNTLVDIFRKYLYFPNQNTHKLLAIYIIGTYFYQSFDAFPFLHFFGPKQSGKSVVSTLITKLAFNAIKVKQISIASLGDSIDSLRCTLVIDQAENLEKSDNIELIGLLADSYKRDGGKRRIVSISNNNRKVVEYETYCPKVFGSTSQLNEDLRDRCILINTMRSPMKMPQSLTENWYQLRDCLYRLQLCLSLELNKSVKQTHELEGRIGELWTPLLAIMELLKIPYPEVNSIKNYFISTMNESINTLEDHEEAIFMSIIDMLKNAEETWIIVKDLQIQVENYFGKSISDRSIGKIISKFQLSFDRDRKGPRRTTRYLFQKDIIIKRAITYGVISEQEFKTDKELTVHKDKFDHNENPVLEPYKHFFGQKDSSNQGKVSNEIITNDEEIEIRV